MKALVIAGDIMESRKLPSHRIRDKLRSAIHHVNRKYQQLIYAPFSIVKGDEIAGVLQDIPDSYKVIRSLQLRVHPLELRIAAVFDEIDALEEKRDVSLIGGRAFWIADEILQYLKKRDLYIRFRLFEDSRRNIVVSDIANLISLSIYRWKERELRAVMLYLKFKNQMAVAEHLGISQPAVSKILRKTGWKIVWRNMMLVNFLINHWHSREIL